MEWLTIKLNSDKLCIFSVYFSIFQYISVTTEKNITPSCYINCTINYFSIEHSWLLDVSGHMNDEQMLTGWVIIIKLVSNYFKWHLGEEFIFFFLTVLKGIFTKAYYKKCRSAYYTQARVLFYKSIFLLADSKQMHCKSQSVEISV